MREELRSVDPRRGVHQDIHGGASRASQARHSRKRQAKDPRNSSNVGNGVQKSIQVPDCHGRVLAHTFSPREGWLEHEHVQIHRGSTQVFLIVIFSI